MMKYLILIALFLLNSIASFGQDKKAKKILDKLSDRYTSLSSISIDFDMTIQQAEEEADVYPSSVIQSGNKFFFKNSEYQYFGNGDDIWIYDHSRNEVQINDFEEDEAEDYVITPLDLLNHYKSGNYAYQMTSKDGSDVEIEFKPTDEFSDYSKFRIYIDQESNEILEIIAFGKDASRVTITISKLVENIAVTDQTFEFDRSQYPGVRIEDLRLD